MPHKTKREYRNADQLFALWKMKESGKSTKEVCSHYGLKFSTVNALFGRIRYMLKNREKHYQHTYTKLLKMIIEDCNPPVQAVIPEPANTVNIVEEEERVKILDVYTNLSSAMEKLQEAIELVVTYEVDRRTQIEKQKVLDLMEEAKHSNWIGNLQNKFQTKGGE
jgi:hypothetical protein